VAVPLSSTEKKIFDEFCVNVEWEQDHNVDEMNLEDPLCTAPLIRTSTKARSRARPPSPSLSASPLSSCPPSPLLEKASLSSEASYTDSASSGCLRRSKRVADALAARSNIQTRSSNRGSRNLS